MRSGIWWASRAGEKVVVRENGPAFTPTWSSMWTGFWRKLKWSKEVEAHLKGKPDCFLEKGSDFPEENTVIMVPPWLQTALDVSKTMF